MRTLGIVLVVIGCIDLLISIIGLATAPEYAEAQTTMLSGAIMFAFLGALFIHLDKKKKKQDEEKGQWNQ